MVATPYLPLVTTDSVVDISHFQGHVDFAALKAGGVTAVFIKATQGAHYVDPMWQHNSQQAAQAGLLYAPYHFLTGDDVTAQYNHLMQVTRLGRDNVVMLDWEKNPEGTTAPPILVATLGNHMQNVTGRAPLIYCGRWQLPAPDPVLSRWPLMLPEYGDKPICPPGWSQWLFHQYTSSGKAAGVTGKLDRSVFAGTALQLESWWKIGALPVNVDSAPAVTPPPDVVQKTIVKPKRAAASKTRDANETKNLNKAELARVTGVK
jgi:lysozyme